MDVIEEIKTIIADNPVVLFMKGTPDFPQCGFSMRTAEALKACNAKFTYVDILAAPDVRANLPKVSNWPTFPQVFINGELIGGCDITLDLYQKGELQKMLETASSEKS
ncbi:MAG: monothiol glutaredoxin, Grx4 family [Gammaproteobacteria bacterium RIFCSPLOWO2_02_FULL_52_10]|nr:MAG: monothiol glutaredoxin, Grx4 family [Gammaproteobacteria bacterium RIFCSPLOWO2_02_FULL_52_10]OGT84094.1 MAG: monothiol glutaredoxin, Grx4 family [Gammaproteobacteria bacterium RIFCSPLOWO2_12_FULL_52_10]